MAYRSQMDLLKEGGKIVEELRDETGETVQLSVLENNVMLVLVKEESSKPIRIISRVGSRVPINWAAAGRPTRTSWFDRSSAFARKDGVSSSTKPTSMPAASRRRSPIFRENVWRR